MGLNNKNYFMQILEHDFRSFSDFLFISSVLQLDKMAINHELHQQSGTYILTSSFTKLL
jgi:hypothetical protein